jgi:hypothetical protein
MTPSSSSAARRLGDAGPVLNFTRDELDAFAAGWMDGEFS